MLHDVFVSEQNNIFDIIIIGGGIIGLSIASEMAEKGKKVIILEKNKIGMEASWAAAGTLEPIWDAEDDGDDLLQIKIKSEAMWRNFAQKIQGETNIDLEYNSSGGLLIAMNNEEMHQLEKTHEVATKYGIESRILSKEEIISMESNLNTQVFGGIFLASECYVNPRKVTEALCKYFEKMGGIVCENNAVTDLLKDENGAIIGVTVPNEKIFAKQIVNCAGPWSSEMTEIKVKPIKGYMLCFAAESVPKIDHVIIHRNSVRILKRKDGTLMAIGIMDDVGFDRELNEEKLKIMRDSANKIIPSLTDGDIIETCSGFRPQGEDRFPVIGKIKDGLYVATGHYKDGILLAPITAKIMYESLSGIENANVSPQRFMKK